MAQVVVYGLRRILGPVRAHLSETIHSCLVEALSLPMEKRFQRLVLLADDEFFAPADRTERYTIIEISMFSGQSVATKKRLLRLLSERLEDEIGIGPADLEVTITETPRENWLIRGLPGDELDLSYPLEP